MSLQNNNELYATEEQRANTAFNPTAELYRIHKYLKKSRDYWATEVERHLVPINEYNTKFYAWLQDEYGLEIIVQNSFIQGISDVRILDEQKFLMFTLKFQ